MFRPVLFYSRVFRPQNGHFDCAQMQDGKTNSIENVHIDNIRFLRRRQFVHAVFSARFPKNKCTEPHMAPRKQWALYKTATLFIFRGEKLKICTMLDSANIAVCFFHEKGCPLERVAIAKMKTCQMKRTCAREIQVPRERRAGLDQKLLPRRRCATRRQTRKKNATSTNLLQA